MSIPQSGGGPIERFEQLAEFLASGCKPKSEWRIGTEHEKFGFLTDSLLPLPYDGPRSIKAVMEGLRDRFGWREVLEQGRIIGLTRGGANVSLEPGGQFELSGAMMDTVHQTDTETRAHLAEVAAVAGPMGVGFMGLGAAPVWSHDQMPMMPKGRYRLMTDYMGRVGTHGTQMMYRTCTVQVNLDFASEADMVQKMRVALALQPVATALFAASPFFDGKVNGHKSWRSRIWRGLDDARTGTLPMVFEPGFGFEAWANYVLDVPMYFVYRDGRYINALGQSFRDFLKGELPALPGQTPTLSDWADHLTTVFPEARMKRYIEMRGADCGDVAHLAALPALWVGLLYDQTALDAAWDLAKGWDAETREALRVGASVDALQATVGTIKMRELAGEVLAISAAGLKARARAGNGMGDEVPYLDVLKDHVQTGRVQADDMLALYHGDWGSDLTQIYQAARL